MSFNRLRIEASYKPSPFSEAPLEGWGEIKIVIIRDNCRNATIAMGMEPWMTWPNGLLKTPEQDST